MNDERPIEKLLRRYAGKRRADAGPPVELHPATRRMLQGEVARQFPRRTSAGREEGTLFAQLWKAWRTRWVWALPVLIVLGVGVWALVGTKEGPGNGFDLAQETPSSAPTAEVVHRSFKAPETPRPAPPPSVVRPASQPAPAYEERVRPRDEPETSLIPTASPGDSSAVALDQTTVRRKPANAPTLGELAGISADRPALKPERVRTAASPLADTAPAEDSLSQRPVERRASGVASSALRDENIQPQSFASSAPAKSDSLEDVVDIRKDNVASGEGNLARAPASKLFESAPKASTTYFSQQARDSSEREHIAAHSQVFANQVPVSSYGAIAKSSSLRSVLKNFKVEQSGNQWRVIDSDGSTYVGELVFPTAKPTVTAALDKVGATESKSKKAGDQFSGRQIVKAGVPGQKEPQNVFAYRVEGTNRTLKQQVVFAWNFVPLSNQPAARQFKVSTRGGTIPQHNLPAQQLPLLLNNSVIHGRAQLNGAKEIQINAVPVTR